MTEVQLCFYCKEIVDKKEEYVVVAKEHQGNPEAVAHVRCAQKQKIEF